MTISEANPAAVCAAYLWFVNLEGDTLKQQKDKTPARVCLPGNTQLTPFHLAAQTDKEVYRLLSRAPHESNAAHDPANTSTPACSVRRKALTLSMLHDNCF